MGYTWSYTEGIISGVRQDAKGVTYYQTQTPINSGNSGGGLYGEDGTLIGLNTWTQDKSVAEGLNFALATTTILRLMPVAQRKRLLSGAEAGEH
jgi:serine protease DegQ